MGMKTINTNPYIIPIFSLHGVQKNGVTKMPILIKTEKTKANSFKFENSTILFPLVPGLNINKIIIEKQNKTTKITKKPKAKITSCYDSESQSDTEYVPNESCLTQNIQSSSCLYINGYLLSPLSDTQAGILGKSLEELRFDI